MSSMLHALPSATWPWMAGAPALLVTPALLRRRAMLSVQPPSMHALAATMGGVV